MPDRDLEAYESDVNRWYSDFQSCLNDLPEYGDRILSNPSDVRVHKIVNAEAGILRAACSRFRAASTSPPPSTQAINAELIRLVDQAEGIADQIDEFVTAFQREDFAAGVELMQEITEGMTQIAVSLNEIAEGSEAEASTYDGADLARGTLPVSRDFYSDIVEAIESKRLLEFFYKGKYRRAEPHVFGILNGRHQLLTFQVGGDSSSGGLPGWRRVNADELVDLRITDERFAGPRPQPSGEHSPFDTTLAVVG